MPQGWVRSGTSEYGRGPRRPRPLDRDAAIRPSAPLARAISFAWADQFRVTYRSAANAVFITHRASERLQSWLITEEAPTRISSRLHSRYAGLVTDLYYPRQDTREDR